MSTSGGHRRDFSVEASCIQRCNDRSSEKYVITHTSHTQMPKPGLEMGFYETQFLEETQWNPQTENMIRH